MSGRETGRRLQVAGRDRTGVAAIAVTLLAIVCCAAGPAILAVFGSLALGAVIGWAAGAAALMVAVAAFVAARRRRRDRSASATPRQAR